ncbi:MAG: HigA family addiction module antidote protein [Coriobacteriales bacterium]|jgi:addiction module HigA family antidote|nr:HigA family addiction module antidote protein [Coriobacteriales bacterium]
MTETSCIFTPGEILKEEFLDPLGISQYRLAKAIQKPQSAVSEIVKGTRAITPEMATLLGRALRTSPQFWMNLEITYRMRTVDLEKIHAEEVPDLIACVG